MKDIERQGSEWNAVILTRSIECELQQPPRNNLRIGKGGFRRRRRHVVLSDIIEQINTVDLFWNSYRHLGPRW